MKIKLDEIYRCKLQPDWPHADTISKRMYLRRIPISA